MPSTNLPFISIVTTSYNHGKYIETNILSVLNQNYANFEHIIIDACSSDDTLEILKKYPHLKWISEPDNGQSDGLNKGFLKASGDWIVWLNSDDILLPDALARYSKAIKNNPCHDIFYGHTVFIDSNSNKIRDLIGVPFKYEYLMHNIFMPPSSGTLFRNSILKGNLLNIEYHYAMDTEWYFRCGKALEFKLINKPLVGFRFWDNKTSNIYLGNQLTDQQVRERNLNFSKYQLPYINKNHNSYRRFNIRINCWLVKIKYFIVKSFYFISNKLFNSRSTLP